jgi:hypothetical protein
VLSGKSGRSSCRISQQNIRVWGGVLHLRDDAGVEPTNNLAEQAIRFVVIDRLVTQGTRSQTGQRWSERIWAVLASCAQQGREAFTYLQEAVRAHFAGGAGTGAAAGAGLSRGEGALAAQGPPGREAQPGRPVRDGGSGTGRAGWHPATLNGTALPMYHSINAYRQSSHNARRSPTNKDVSGDESGHGFLIFS